MLPKISLAYQRESMHIFFSFKHGNLNYHDYKKEKCKLSPPPLKKEIRPLSVIAIMTNKV